MKALTLHQPWASLVAAGHKSVETRSWWTRHRGPIAIHAAKRPPEVGLKVGDYRVSHARWPEDAPWQLWAEAPHLRHTWTEIPLGAVVAIAELVEVYPIVGPGDRVRWAEPYVAWWTGAPPRDPDASLHVWEEDEATINLTAQAPYGDYNPGRYAWMLEDVRVLSTPIPATGRQGLWTWRPVA